jgi:hypothetical protein
MNRQFLLMVYNYIVTFSVKEISKASMTNPIRAILFH